MALNINKIGPIDNLGKICSKNVNRNIKVSSNPMSTTKADFCDFSYKNNHGSKITVIKNSVKSLFRSISAKKTELSEKKNIPDEIAEACKWKNFKKLNVLENLSEEEKFLFYTKTEDSLS